MEHPPIANIANRPPLNFDKVEIETGKIKNQTQEEDRLNDPEDREDITQDEIKIRKNKGRQLHTRIGSEMEHPFHLQIANIANRPPLNFDKVEIETGKIKNQTNQESDSKQMRKELLELYKAQAKSHRDVSKPTADNQNLQ